MARTIDNFPLALKIVYRAAKFREAELDAFDDETGELDELQQALAIVREDYGTEEWDELQAKWRTYESFDFDNGSNTVRIVLRDSNHEE